jgi:hypothetical protein
MCLGTAETWSFAFIPPISPLFTHKGRTLEPLKLLRTLGAETYGDWNAWFRNWPGTRRNLMEKARNRVVLFHVVNSA